VGSRKFYFFDCGITNTLLGRKISQKTPEFGKSFEHFLVLETLAAKFYEKNIEKIEFWRSSSGIEVDLLLNGDTAVEFKSGTTNEHDAKGIIALEEDIRLKKKIDCH
jgi:uncharacterized protein